MKYLLDTCVVSDFIKGERGTLEKMKAVLPSDVAISTITIMEIQYGLMLNPSRAQSIRTTLRDFISAVHILDFNREDARDAAMIRSILKQQGRLIGSYDILLAGTALNRKLILITANTKEFNRVDGLVLENWRK